MQPRRSIPQIVNRRCICQLHCRTWLPHWIFGAYRLQKHTVLIVIAISTYAGLGVGIRLPLDPCFHPCRNRAHIWLLFVSLYLSCVRYYIIEKTISFFKRLHFTTTTFETYSETTTSLFSLTVPSHPHLPGTKKNPLR